MKYKKLIPFVVLSVLATDVFAQSGDTELIIASSSDERAQVELFSHLGFGYNIAKTDDFKANNAWEFFFNVVEFSYYPVDNFGFQLGVDLISEWFNQKGNKFFLNSDREVRTMDSEFNKVRGGFSIFGFNAPLLLKYRSGNFSFGAGVEGNLNASGNTYYTYRENNHRTSVNENRAKIGNFSYGFLATVSNKDTGIYFRYHPKSSKLLANSFEFSYFTIGLVWGF